MAFGDRLARQMVEDDRRARQIVEHRLQPLVEERQPVLHAGEAPSLADRRIERVVARRRAERLDVAAAEAADRLRRQRHFAHRPAASTALRWPVVRWRGGVEGADRLQRVAEEIEPQRLVGAGREEVENAAAHGEFADVAHRRHALEAGNLQPRRSAHSCRSGCRAWRGTSAPRSTSAGGMRCSSALAVVRMTARCGFLLQRDHRRQRVEPPGRGVGRRRDAVVGQAVPGREFEHRQVGRDEGERLDDRRQALAVARDEQDRLVGRDLVRRQRPARTPRSRRRRHRR